MTSEQRALNRVKALLEEMIELRSTSQQGPCPSSTTLRRARMDGNVTIRIFARIADKLGYEVVLNVREKGGK